MKIAITGSSGMIGSVLCPRLAAARHEVVRIRNGDPSDAGVQWNPEAGWLREGELDGVNAVLHLGGTSIDGGHWGAAHQKAIRWIRIDGVCEIIAGWVLRGAWGGAADGGVCAWRGVPGGGVRGVGGGVA